MVVTSSTDSVGTRRRVIVGEVRAGGRLDKAAPSADGKKKNTQKTDSMIKKNTPEGTQYNMGKTTTHTAKTESVHTGLSLSCPPDPPPPPPPPQHTHCTDRHWDRLTLTHTHTGDTHRPTISPIPITISLSSSPSGLALAPRHKMCARRTHSSTDRDSLSLTHTNSKHWFTTSFLQPLPYLVTPQGPEN